MKRGKGALAALAALLIGTALHAQTLSLDQGIAGAEKDIEQYIARGVSISVVNMNAGSDALSRYIIDELTGLLVRSRRFKVLDRGNVEIILKEHDFQMSGYVADASAAGIGLMLGAQSVVTGSLQDAGSTYRLSVRCLNVKTAEVETMYQASISKQDAQIAYWLKAPSPAPIQTSAPTITETPSPAGDFEYEITGSGASRTVTITGYKGAGGKVVIPDKINGLPVTTIRDYAFGESLTSVSIPTSVTSIWYGVFSGCRNLTDITVDSRNPNYSSNNGVLFDKQMKRLIKYPAGKNGTSYTIPASVTSIGDWAFYECKSLTNVSIPASVTSIGGGAFARYESLTGISVDGMTPADNTPDWINEVPPDDVIWGIGVAKQSSLVMSRITAEARSRVAIARYLNRIVQAMFTDYNREAGTTSARANVSLQEDVSRQVSNTRLNGATLNKSWTAPDGAVWLRMQFSKADAKAAVSAIFYSESAQYAEFKVDQALRMLDTQWAKSQGKPWIEDERITYSDSATPANNTISDSATPANNTMIPDWINEIAPDNVIWGIGVAKQSSPSMSRITAEARGRVAIVRALNTNVQAMFTDYNRDAGTTSAQANVSLQEDVSRQLINIQLNGATLNTSWTRPDGTVWIRMQFSKADAKARVSAIFNSERSQYAEFKVDQALRMLDTQLAKSQGKPLIVDQ